MILRDGALLVSLFLFATSLIAMEQTPEYLYKVLSIMEWEKSQQTGAVNRTENDKKFFHLATHNQLQILFNKYWAVNGCVVLKLRTDILVGTLKHESNTPNEDKYYHLYNGEIPLQAIVETTQE